MFLSVLIILTPFVMVYILGKSTKGKGSAFKGIVPVVLVSGLSFLIPEMVVSYFVTDHCCVQALITITFRNGDEIFKA